MKILFLKQASDVSCPFKKYSKDTFLDKEVFLSLFKWKAGGHYQFFLSKNPDYEIAKEYQTYSYHKQWDKSFFNSVLAGLEYSISMFDVKYNDYDIVITTNPFLKREIIENNPKTLFVTFIEEHAFPELYSIKNSYDLFFNHTPH